MVYTDTHCNICGKELRTRNLYSDVHLCSGCWSASKEKETKRKIVKIKEALAMLKGRGKPGVHRDGSTNYTGKLELTNREIGQLKRIYGEHV